MSKEFWGIVGIILCFIVSIVGMVLSQSEDM